VSTVLVIPLQVPQVRAFLKELLHFIQTRKISDAAIAKALRDLISFRLYQLTNVQSLTSAECSKDFKQLIEDSIRIRRVSKISQADNDTV
jgi:hypothetical protein